MFQEDSRFNSTLGLKELVIILHGKHLILLSDIFGNDKLKVKMSKTKHIIKI